MTDQIQVSVELNKQQAERNLRDLAKELSAADSLVNQMRRSGIIWAEDFSEAITRARNEVSKFGTITSKATNEMIKGNTNYAKSLGHVASQVKKVQTNLRGLGANVIIPQDASKLSATAALRDDNEKRRQAYMAKLQTSYQKEQAALTAHKSKLDAANQAGLAKEQAQLQARGAAREAYAAQERAALQKQRNELTNHWRMVQTIIQANAKKAEQYKLKSIKQLSINTTNASALSSTASLGGLKSNIALLKQQDIALKNAEKSTKQKSKTDKAAINTANALASAGKRLSVVNLSQARTANKLASSWRLAKQEMRESISVANLFQTAARGLTGIVSGLVYSFASWVKLMPTLASDMLGFRNALELVTGSQTEATNLLNTSIEIAQSLKLSITAVTKEYSKFTNSATIAGLSVKEATTTFENFAIAARVLNLNQQRTSGMFLALEQMISKGRVSMEELRRQLGEHIPGALNLAAKAMGYGTDQLGEFIKEVAKGNVVSTDLVTNLGKLLKERTINQLPTALQKFSAAATDVSNAFTELGIRLGDIMSKVLVPAATVIANVVRAIAEWVPQTDLLGTANSNLQTTLVGVNKIVTTTDATFNSIAATTEKLNSTMQVTTMSYDDFKKSIDGVGLAGTALLGIIGTAGLGGVFAALGLSLKLIKVGILAALAPFASFGNAIKNVAKLLGAGALGKAVFSLKVQFQALALTIEATLARLAVFALANPFGAAIAAIGALGAGLWYARDRATEFDEAVKSSETAFVDANTEANKLIDTTKTLADKMLALGQIELAVKMQQVTAEQEKWSRAVGYINDQNNALKDQHTFWDSIIRSWGFTTEHAANLAKRMEANKSEIQAIKVLSAGVNGEMQTLVDTAGEVVNQFEAMRKALQQSVDQAELIDVMVDISLVGEDNVTASIVRVQREIEKKRESLKLANKDLQLSDSDKAYLNELEKQKIQLIKVKAAYKSTQAAQKAFESSYNSFSGTLIKTTTKLEQQNEAFGVTGIALDKLNASYKIAALNEKLLEVESKATTNAMRERAAVLRNQISIVTELYNKNIQLREQERIHQELVRQKADETKKLIDLQKKGAGYLEETLTLEQKFALRTREIIPALEAVGATNVQVTEVLRKEWAKIVDESNTGLKSIETIAEEVAKGMFNNFSDFFFDAMEGKFTNLADGFTAMLNRMVADAAAAQLSKYIMGGAASGSGVIGTILNSGIGQALGAGPSMPAASSTLQTSGGFFVNLPGFANGADFMVGGAGGIDSQIVAFRASPKERVRVETPQQQQADRNQPSQTVNVSFTVNTPNADSFNASRGQIEMYLRESVMRASRNS